ncbi:cyclase family protein [Altererythrobacter sp. MF3-039]|uniref:cyclase family protein n=1 Tax=Altererythrobacter sp. MF3-039 TaxID=3252901 RepID=UPI00390CA443
MQRNRIFGMGLAAMLLAGAACTKAPDAEEDTAPVPAPDSTFGMAGTITPEKVAKAAGLVTEGKVYALGVITGPDSVAYPGRSFSIIAYDGGPAQGANKVTAHDDRLETHVGIGSQIDGFGHIGRDGVHFGGRKREDFFAADGLKELGTEHIPPIATRGVLLDMAKHFGVERLEPMQGFGREDIQAAAEAQGVTIGHGDVVLFHTGWLTMEQENGEAYIAQQPGISIDGAEYLAELGVVAIGADSAALETMAFEGGNVFPVHQFLLVDAGIYVLETMNTAELAADGAHEFFFVLGQPRFAGSVQAVINPIAIR